MSRLSLAALLLSLFFSAPTHADATGTQADHDALRQLKASAVEAVNQRDYAALQGILHQPSMTTLVTQDSFTDPGKLKDYFENLFTRDTLRMKEVRIAAEADDLSQIYEGTFALNKGSTKERYTLADGRSFDIDGRWTAVSIKENGQWKLLAVHTGTNFLDNPVLNAIEKSVLWTGAVGAAAGLLIGFAAGWLLRRRSGKAAA